MLVSLASVPRTTKGAQVPQADKTKHSNGPRVSIRDIAQEAGVSTATVSAFLSGKRPVSASTSARLEAAIKARGYRVNAAARALAHGRTNAIGLLIPPQGGGLSPFAVDFIASVVQHARAADYDVLVSISAEERKVFARLIEEQRVDGVILLEVSLEDQRVDRLRAAGVPFVAVGRTADPTDYAWVDIDFEGLARAFVRHLVDLRHERIVMFNTSRELFARGFGPACRAQDGFLQACGEFGVHGRVVYCESNPEAGLRLTQDLLAEGAAFTAIAVINDYSIWGIYQALALAGRRIPADVSVIALADQRWPEALSPRLTSAHHPVEDMGAEAVKFLVRLLEDGTRPPMNRLFKLPIILRESTAAAPALRPAADLGDVEQGPLAST
jgi:DNA-binding LacI/PurR family transcriptional regulator